ncbi:uncharacterized protein DUF1524 [Kribbella sp. VKM Ac-2527]|uniref:Uncharacterized protein DUF1524 n=1 Tax=Kribbella caucasensis TaxID=2512215 RepID=A0A4V3C5R8_9ACTN|nr:DUF262 domain-containing protein [Kribbella sp. VKM Ac-2527]TDO30978.1 uncharacterized protein DUF1524 [Kribbella sp. VKM Ac-2527]
MDAKPYAPADIFGTHVRYVVPLFQRPYVWNQKDQWQPLWDDVSALAERILEAPPGGYGVPPVPPHFLGAIVVDQQPNPTGFIAVRHIIDGQQRLTTLQLLLDAAQWVVEHYGNAADSHGLRVLVQNNPEIAQHPDQMFKVWPTDRDQAAFRAAMDNDTVVPAELSGSRIAQAHAFFIDAISDWAEVASDEDKVKARLSALVTALRTHLRLVVIDLEPGDNAQVIFETLNHRGTPLLAADLVKNLVFQIAQSNGLPMETLYTQYWRELDGDYWRQQVAQGRLFRPRIDVFLNHWLTMKLMREVPTDRIFTEFRDGLIVTQQPDLGSLLAELASDADVYRKMDLLPPASVEGRFQYRVIKAMDTAVVGPLLMWLLRWTEEDLPETQRHKALNALESWLVRRALCRLTSKDTNKLVLELLQELNYAGPAIAGNTVEAVLARQTAQSRFWPDDALVQQSLAEEPVYKLLTRPRLRMILEALEDATRGPLGEGQACPRNLTVEHVMPQSWKDYWGGDLVGDEIGALRRDRTVQTLGNLTLVNDKLNPSMSNRPWTAEQAEQCGLGKQGKRDYLLGHSQLKLNASLVTANPSAWTEHAIIDRTRALSTVLTSIWPCPATVAQPARPPSSKERSTAYAEEARPGHAGKYQALWRWLDDNSADEVRLTFDEVEQILGLPLPPSARDYQTHWKGYSGTALGRAIRDAGWRAVTVGLNEQRVVLQRDTSEGAEPIDELGSGGWSYTDDDVEAAKYIWAHLSDAARAVMRTLMDAAPERVVALELAEAHQIRGGILGVAGVLTWPARYSADVRRPLPVHYDEGAVGQGANYWMDVVTASVFNAAIG